MNRFEIAKGHHTRVASLIPFPTYGLAGYPFSMELMADRYRASSIQHCQLGG